MSSKPSTCTEESGAAPGFQSSGASADTQLASTTPPTGTCSSEANIDNPDLNLAANTDFTFYIVVDVKATAVLWNAVDFRVKPGQTGVQFRNLAARRAKCLWYKSLSRRCKYMEPRGLYDRRRSIRFQLQPVHTRLRRRSNQLRGKLGSRSLSRFGPSPRSRFENFCSVGKTFGCTGNARYVWNEPFNVQLQ